MWIMGRKYVESRRNATHSHIKVANNRVAAALLILATLVTPLLHAGRPHEMRNDNDEMTINSQPVKNRDFIDLMTPAKSRFLKELYSQYPDPNDEERAFHVSMLRLFYDELTFSEIKDSRLVVLFMKLLDCRLADSVSINKIYDEVFIRFGSGLGLGDFRREIKERVRTALGIRRDFHEWTKQPILGIGDLAYHILKLGINLEIEAFGTEKIIHPDDSIRVKTVDVETFGENFIVLYFHSNNMRIKYIKDSILGYYKANEVLVRGPYDSPIEAATRAAEIIGGEREPHYSEKFAPSSVAQIMEKVTGVVEIAGPPLLRSVRLYPFVFPFPGEWDRSANLEEQAWDAYGGGVDIYGSLDELVALDSADYRIEILITNLSDTLFRECLSREVGVPGGTSSEGFHQRYFCGIFHRQSAGRADSGSYSLGWKFVDIRSGKETKAVDVIALPSAINGIPHFTAMIVSENQDDLNLDAGNPYRDIPNFAPPKKWKNEVKLWFPVKGLQEDDRGRFAGNVDVILNKHNQRQTSRAGIIRESMRYSYDEDNLELTQEPNLSTLKKKPDGFIGTYEIIKSGPNGFCTIDIPLNGVKAGDYDVSLFVTTMDPATNKRRLISTASLEYLRAGK
ncbi:hypothetical protein TRIP_C20601 [Candidatus Zixiibacteriota bacterium]|nr:hypothetical protein TRIP_C20601 [candidate division Zixibacteria bacterium]